MQTIRNFVSATSQDLRSGRESWRVFGFFWSCAFVIASALTLVRAVVH